MFKIAADERICDGARKVEPDASTLGNSAFYGSVELLSSNGFPLGAAYVKGFGCRPVVTCPP